MAHANNFYLLLLLSVFIQVACCGWKIDEIKRIFKLKWYGTPQKPIPGPIVKGCNLCVWGTCTPAMKGVPDGVFSAQVDAEELKKAMERVLRIKKETIVSIITNRSELQRQEISIAFKAKTAASLGQKITDNVVPEYRRTGILLSMLSMPIHEFYAYRINKLTQIQPYTTGSDQKDRINMIEMFTTLPPCLIRKISQYYNEKNGKGKMTEDIERYLKNQFPQTDYIEVILSMAKGSRDDDLRTSLFRAWRDASRMKAAVVMENWEQKKATFKEIFTQRSIPQLGETIRLYEKMRGTDKGFTSLEVDIEKGMESAKEIYGTMVKIIRNQPNYFADVVDNILDGKKGADDEKFIMFLRGRSDIDLGDIKESYKKRYRRELLTKVTIRDKGHGGPFYDSLKNILEPSTT